MSLRDSNSGANANRSACMQWLYQILVHAAAHTKTSRRLVHVKTVLSIPFYSHKKIQSGLDLENHVTIMGNY